MQNHPKAVEVVIEDLDAEVAVAAAAEAEGELGCVVASFIHAVLR